MKKALFLDFEDSFTFNVVQELTNIGLQVEVIHWSLFRPDMEADLLVLGPGPGRPDDYQEIFPWLEKWMVQSQKIFAVCLGHQILWRLLGHEVVRAKSPLHGQKIKLSLNSEWQAWLNLPQEIWVQRYNSLAVTDLNESHDIINYIEEGEIIMSRCPHFISYQFHPESVGTNCRESFFHVIRSHLL